MILALEETNTWYISLANPAWLFSWPRFFLFFAFLKAEKESTCRITGGISSQILGPK